jgi:hypothetical protein
MQEEILWDAWHRLEFYNSLIYRFFIDYIRDLFLVNIEILNCVARESIGAIIGAARFRAEHNQRLNRNEG